MKLFRNSFTIYMMHSLTPEIEGLVKNAFKIKVVGLKKIMMIDDDP